MKSVHIEHCFVQRSLLIFGVKEREGILFHALSALEGPAARKVPSLISHGHLEGCRVAEEEVVMV